MDKNGKTYIEELADKYITNLTKENEQLQAFNKTLLADLTKATENLSKYNFSIIKKLILSTYEDTPKKLIEELDEENINTITILKDCHSLNDIMNNIKNARRIEQLNTTWKISRCKSTVEDILGEFDYNMFYKALFEIIEEYKEEHKDE